MTTTTHPTCDSILIESDYLTDDNISVTLNVTINCDTEYIIQVDPEDADITVDPDALGLDQETLSDGVYYLVLTIVDDELTTITETACVLVNCTLTCQMLDTFTAAAGGNDEAAIRALSYYALISAAGCTSCACSDLCTLYNGTQLNNCETNVTTCGCS